ncbi:hypothetical protein AB0F30_08550 [Streptomyces sp. NPDC029006]|uniref:hypothetical protein n=1 Tax=Streptomyces sp. NPDC029006 TaxID=3155467 RepID=UPI0033E18F89
MGDGNWWVALVTGATALGASWITTRGNARSVRVEAEVNAHADHIAEARNRRRDAYRDLSTAVHALSEVFWKMEVVDLAQTRAERVELIDRMHVASRRCVSEVTRTSRDVCLEGPAAAAKAAGELGRRAVDTHLLLIGLHDGTEETRSAYDDAYRGFTEQHVHFLDVARAALEVG